MVKVLVSEWTRKAAHNLDFAREQWIASRSASNLTDVAVSGLRLRDDFDHSDIWGYRLDAVTDVHTNAVHDVHLLQSHLTSISIQRKVDGEVLPRLQYETYRAMVIKRLQYVQMIASVCRKVMERFKRDLLVSRSSTIEDLSPVEIIRRLELLFRKKMRDAYGKTWFSLLDEDDQVFISAVPDYVRLNASLTPGAFRGIIKNDRCSG